MARFILKQTQLLKDPRLKLGLGVVLALPIAGRVISKLRKRQKYPVKQPAYQGYPEYNKYTLVGSPDPASDDFVRAVEYTTLSPMTDGNNLELLINGDQIFPSMLEAIRNAQRTINIVTFIYWKGEIAYQVAGAICERARAGVQCNVLLDAIGAAKIDHKLVNEMREAGAKVSWFRPPRWYNLNRIDNRTHRKVLVVDGQIGFTGGVGIAKEWTGNAQDSHHWRDTHVRLEGPSVLGLQSSFCENWLEATGEMLTGPDYLPALKHFQNGVKVQVTRSSAGKADSNAETLFFLAIAAARKRIWLTTAYFVPGPAFEKALMDSAQRGVDVRILVPGPHANKKLVREAGRATYEKLLRAGVVVYEYQPTMLHAKTLVIDSIWSSIGSTNFDNRSFSLNEEANISVHDALVAQTMEKQFEFDLSRSKKLKPGLTPIKVLEWPLEKFSSLFGREI